MVLLWCSLDSGFAHLMLSNSCDRFCSGFLWRFIHELSAHKDGISNHRHFCIVIPLSKVEVQQDEVMDIQLEPAP
jgi:hypothetical protein